MKPLAFRIPIVLAVMVSWAFASNHCALGALLAKPDAHACCHAAPERPAPAMTDCCQALNAPLPDAATAPATVFFVVAPAWSSSLVAPPSSADRDAAVLFFSHGPPGVRSFAELVLQRSLPVHAPPFEEM